MISPDNKITIEMTLVQLMIMELINKFKVLTLSSIQTELHNVYTLDVSLRQLVKSNLLSKSGTESNES